MGMRYFAYPHFDFGLPGTSCRAVHKYQYCVLINLGKGVRQMNDLHELFQVKGNILIVRVPEELDHHSAETIREGSEEILETLKIREVVFDFHDTQFMDSSGIGMLMARYREMKQMGGTIRAVHVRKRVAKILQLSGIYKVIPIELIRSWNDL